MGKEMHSTASSGVGWTGEHHGEVSVSVRKSHDPSVISWQSKYCEAKENTVAMQADGYMAAGLGGATEQKNTSTLFDENGRLR
jgi:hypothetical protein